MTQPVSPEPKFFLIDELYNRGIEYYSRTWFDQMPATAIRGEKTTNYLENRDAAERIRQNLPDAKLVFILREPVERAYSNFLWSKQNGLEHEASFERALDLEQERERSYPPEWQFSRPHSYFSRGLYAEHLKRFLDRFPAENILVLKTEDAFADPSGVANAFYRFVGASENDEIAKAVGTVNAISDRGTPIPESTRTLLAERYREPNRQLGELLGNRFHLW